MNQDTGTPVKRNRRSGWSIAFSLVLFSVVSAGAWFLFSPDNLNKKLSQAISSFSEATQPGKNKPEKKNSQIVTEKNIPLQNTKNRGVPENPNKEQLQPPTAKTVAEQVAEENLNTKDDRSALQSDNQSTETNPPGDNPQDLIPLQNCEELTTTLLQFFDHIDRQPYLKDFKLQKPILNHFNELTAELLKNPPVVTRESDDLYTILTNMAHFFRIIGKDNILLIKGILDRERDKIEDVAAELYKWGITDKCSPGKLQLQLPLAGVYEYAGFFLNTMGGRSYLFRRDSRSRLLVNYYAILIIDQANKAQVNAHGLDVRELIPRLIQEIEATNQLIYREDYIDTLNALQEQYRVGSE